MKTNLTLWMAFAAAVGCSVSIPATGVGGSGSDGGEDSHVVIDGKIYDLPVDPNPDIHSLPVKLTQAKTCDDIIGSARSEAMRQMHVQLNASIRSYLQGGTYCGRPIYAAMDSGSAAAAPPSGKASDDRATSATTTNNQVVGVDEADFVKNDTKYIYHVKGNALRIIDAWPADQMHVVGTASIEGTAKELFVEGDRALVYSSLFATPSTGSPYSYAPRGACTYGYDCDFRGDGTPTLVSIYDIADLTQPKLLKKIRLSGSLIAARRIGTAIHTVVADTGVTTTVPGTTTYLSSANICNDRKDGTIEERLAQFEAMRQKNVDLINAYNFSLQLPSIAEDGGANQYSCQNTFVSGDSPSGQVTTVLSMDLRAPSKSVVSVVSRPGAVYASSESLYIAVPQARSTVWGWYDDWNTTSELSTVHKFRVGADAAGTSYAGTGLVKGRVLNQFSMDERDGYLRIATTTGHAPLDTAHSTLSVMQLSGQGLETVGQIDKIAPTEDIRSVRFDGDRGYVVTFKKTDPLFVFNLADPRHPVAQSELMIPGFSTYMHMMDDTHLLTIGYDAADQGSYAYFAGVLLQIFDVSNALAPTLLHRESIGARGSSSEALTNHLAFTYFAEKNLLALPMTVCEGGDPSHGIYGSNLTFSGLMVYEVSLSGGFKLRGKMPFATPDGPTAPTSNYYNPLCNNWWTGASSVVKRSIIMDNIVFGVSGDTLKAGDVANLSSPISFISL